MPLASLLLCAVIHLAPSEPPNGRLAATCPDAADRALPDWPAALARCTDCPYVVTTAAAERLAAAAPPALTPAATVRDHLLALDREVGLRVWQTGGVMVWLTDAAAPALPAAAARRWIAPPAHLHDALEHAGAADADVAPPASATESETVISFDPRAMDARRPQSHLIEAVRLCRPAARRPDDLDRPPGRGTGEAQ